MEKPTTETVIIKRLYYDKVIKYIEQKYNIKTRDYLGKYSKKPFDPELENQDFWVFLVNAAWYGEVRSGEDKLIPISDMLCNMEELLDYLNELAPLWVKEIAQLIKDEFGDLLDSEGNLEVYVSW